MSRPKGMSRKDYRNLKTIIRERMGDGARIDISTNSVSGFRFVRHDEGSTSHYIEAWVGDNPGTYEIRDEDWGSDCDGRHSQSENYTVGSTGKRKRWYPTRDWKANRPAGKFGVKAQFRTLERGAYRQRDYTAEEAGY